MPDGFCPLPLKEFFEFWFSDEDVLALEFSEFEAEVSLFPADGIEEVEISPSARTTSFPIMDVTFPATWVWFEERAVVSVCAGRLELLLFLFCEFVPDEHPQAKQKAKSIKKR